MTRHRPTVARARTLAGLVAAGAVLVGCTGTPDKAPTTAVTQKSVPAPVLSAPTRGVVPARAVIAAPGTSGTLTVTVRSVDVSAGTTVVTWAMRWDDPDRADDDRTPVGYFYDGDAKPPTLVDRTAMQVHYPLCPGGAWNGGSPAVCGFDGLYSPNADDSTKLTNHQTLEAWAVFSEVGPDTQTVDLTMPAGLLTSGGVLTFPQLPVTRDPPGDQPEPEQPVDPDAPADPAAPPTATSAPSLTTPLDMVVDAPGAPGTLTVTVDAVTALDTATVVTWAVRWDNPDKPDSDYREMASLVHNDVTFVPTLVDRAAMRAYLPLCTVNSWHPGARISDSTDATNCAYAGLFSPNDRDRSGGLRLVNHQSVEGWAVFPPVGPDTATVDLALPHTLPAFFALPVTHATEAPAVSSDLALMLASLQVTDEMRSQATLTLDAGGTVFPFARTDGTAVSLTSDLLFETGTSVLTETALAALTDLAGQIPEGATVTVDGHTDSLMDSSVNIPLSRDQAQAVANALAAVRPDLTLAVAGHGSSAPVAANSNSNGTDRPIGRQLNRRVTLTY